MSAGYRNGTERAHPEAKTAGDPLSEVQGLRMPPGTMNTHASETGAALPTPGELMKISVGI